MSSTVGMSSTTGAGTAASSVRLSVGALLNATGKLRYVRNTSGDRATRLFTVCPHCEKGKAKSAGYVCDGCEQPFSDSDLRGKMVAGEVLVVPKEEVEAAKQSSLPKGALDLAFYPADQVESQTVDAGVAYFFEPDTPNALVTLLVRKAADPGLAVIGIMNLSSEKLYRLTTDGRGNLFLTELLRPEESHRFGRADLVEPQPADAEMFERLTKALVEDFDPDIYASAAVANLSTLLAERAGGAEIIPITTTTEKPNELASALELALAAVKAKKGA